MSAERIGSKTPPPPDHGRGAKYLPIGVIDVELSVPPTELVDDTTEFVLVSEQEPPAAVLKVARGFLGRMELRAQRRVLSELAIHPRLDAEWRELLPRILAFGGRGNATVSVESFRPGVDLADLLACHPDRLEQLTAAALTAIAPLHRRTTTFVGVRNGCMLRRWLAERLTALTNICHRLDPGRAPTAELLAAVLLRDVRGWQLPLGWTHGSYLPGNVRVEGREARVTGIVDWGGAGRGRGGRR
ncbi:MAG: phosphotransferase [Mycobacterium sp.]|nr:phosphotransferase [Mycobacterium sp.]